MTGWHFETGTLSDLSATIFSVFLLLLVLLLDEAFTDGVPQQPLTLERAPTGAAAMADLLYQRRPGAAGTRIDISGDGFVVARPGVLSADAQAATGEARMSAGEIGRALRAGTLPDPLRLYVFDNRPYDSLARLLTAGGRQWTEMNVPDALKGTEGDTGARTHWSAEFREILANSASKDHFVRELARLLAGHGARKEEALRGERLAAGKLLPAPPGARPTGPSFLARIEAWLALPLRDAFGVLMIALGITVVAGVEWKRRRPGQRGSSLPE